MRVDYYDKVVVVFKPCVAEHMPFKHSGCMCMGTCQEVRAVIPRSEWDAFIDLYPTPTKGSDENINNDSELLK